MADQKASPGPSLAEAIQKRDRHKNSRRDFISKFSDADTLQVGGGFRNAGYNIRLWGIDAPESGQPVWTSDPEGPYVDAKGKHYSPDSGGSNGAATLTDYFMRHHNPPVLIEPEGWIKGTGQGGPRIVGRVRVEDKPGQEIPDLSRTLVASGLASAYPEYGGDAYNADQRQAEQAHRGYNAVDHATRYDVPEPNNWPGYIWRDTRRELNRANKDAYDRDITSKEAMNLLYARRRPEPSTREANPETERQWESWQQDPPGSSRLFEMLAQRRYARRAKRYEDSEE